MKKEKKENLKRIALGWGVAFIFAIVVAIICLIAAHSQGMLQVAKADSQGAIYTLQDNIEWSSEISIETDDDTVVSGSFAVVNVGQYALENVRIVYEYERRMTIYIESYSQNMQVQIEYQESVDPNIYEIESVRYITINNNQYTTTASNIRLSISTMPSLSDEGLELFEIVFGINQSGGESSGGESGGDVIQPEDEIPDIDTSCAMQFLLSEYYTYTYNDIIKTDTYLLGYMVTNAANHLNNQGICTLKIYYRDENENWIYKEVNTIRVRTASNPTVEYHYFMPYDYGSTYRIAFKENENNSDWCVVFPSRFAEANATQLDIASVVNSDNLMNYLMPSRNSYVKNEVEAYQDAAIGLYAGMDIVTGIFAKIGELLNVNIFGSIPLYVFILIPLIMGVVYVVLKFVR